MFITFRSIMFVILSILLLPCSSIEIEIPRIIDSDIIPLGTYFDSTMLLQVSSAISGRILYLIHPNGTFNHLDNINITCADLDCYELAYPLNPNYILIKSLEGIIITDWMGNILTNLSMTSDPSFKINASKKNDSRFLVAENNQTHL